MGGIRTIREQVGGFPATFWWLWAGGLVNALANFVFPFLALFLTARGYSPSEAGAVAALFGVANVVAGPVGGGLADRIGRRPTLAGSLCLAAGAAAAVGFAPGVAAMAGLVFLFGLGTNMARPAISAAVADVVLPEDRARAFGLVYWASNLGIGVSMAVGGAIAAWSWRALFLADAVSTLAFAAFVWRRVGETRPRADPAPVIAAASFGAVLRDRRFLAWLGLHLGWALVFTQFLAAAPIDMAARGLPASAIGPVLSVNGLLIALVHPWVTPALARRRVSRVLAAGAALVGVGYGAYAICADGWQFALATAVWTIGELVYLPVAMAHVAELSPPALRGRYQGAYGVSWGVAATLSPVLGPAVLEHAGAAALWGGCLALSLAVAAGQLALVTAVRGAPGSEGAARPGAPR